MARDLEHVVPPRVYVRIFVVLLALTALTTAVAFVDLGALNNVIMLTIAVTKATLVVLFFMHVRYSSRFTQVVVSSGFLWLLILLFFTTLDMVVRRPPLLGVDAVPRAGSLAPPAQPD